VELGKIQNSAPLCLLHFKMLRIHKVSLLRPSLFLTNIPDEFL